jgi:hypothetical protein
MGKRFGHVWCVSRLLLPLSWRRFIRSPPAWLCALALRLMHLIFPFVSTLPHRIFSLHLIDPNSRPLLPPFVTHLHLLHLHIAKGLSSLTT